MRARLRRLGLFLVTALLTGVVAGSIPLPAPVEHGDDHVHIEVDHGGHGTTLIDQSERIGGRTTPPVASAAMPLPPVDPSRRQTRSRRNTARMPDVRAPPTNPSRAPPLSS